MTTAIKPPFTYFGGKTQIAPKIAALLPPHEHYVEAYAGSLAVLLAKRPSPMETVNDLDGDLMTFWRVLRDQPQQLERLCALTPHSRAEHQASLDPAPPHVDDVERARRVWVRLTQGRSGTLGRRTGWRYYQDPRGSGASMPGYLDAYTGRIAAAAARLHSVSLECLPATDLIGRYGQHERCLIYADPPYLGETRTWGVNYAREMRGEDEHRELAHALQAARAAVVVSGYHCELYDDLYAGWNVSELRTQTGNATSGNRSRVEVLWSNRPLARQLTMDPT
jgi:DNA adenine methylase